MLSKFKLNQLYFKDTQFANLMTRRIFNVLLIVNRWPNYRPCHTTLSYVCREQEITRDLT